MKRVEQVNPEIAIMIQRLRARGMARANTDMTTKPQQASILVECGLDTVECEKCGNTGSLIWKDEDGMIRAKECGCMTRRRAIRRLKDSGLRDMVQRYSFENYQCPTEAHRAIMAKAKEFACGSAEFFFVCGKPGTGKTHICTAICSCLLDKDFDIRYMVWRTDAADLKGMVNDREAYRKAINRLRNTPVLYIDDLFKGAISQADVNLAFTLLNDRYNSSGKKTIISTELSIEEISRIDDAIAGRIAERARGYLLTAPNKNWRAT